MFVTRFGCILETLRDLSVTGNPREQAEAKGLTLQLSSFESIFVLHLLDSVLPLINSLSSFRPNLVTVHKFVPLWQLQGVL